MYTNTFGKVISDYALLVMEKVIKLLHAVSEERLTPVREDFCLIQERHF